MVGRDGQGESSVDLCSVVSVADYVHLRHVRCSLLGISFKCVLLLIKFVMDL